MGKSLLAASVLETLASKIGAHGFLKIAVEGDQELTCPSATSQSALVSYSMVLMMCRHCGATGKLSKDDRR